MNSQIFEERLRKASVSFAPVVPFAPGDKLLQMDFTAANTELTDEILKDTERFGAWVNEKLTTADARYGIGGYNEHRTIYSRSDLFSPSEPPPTPPTGESNAQPSPAGDADVSIGEFYWSADPIQYGLLKQFVAAHRQEPTLAESVLWEQLRNQKLGGYKFRRQHIIGNCIADFVCLTKQLIIEVDGLYHQLPDQIRSDEERTTWLKQQGFSVLRFTNDQVLLQTEQTLKTTLSTLEAMPPIPKKHYQKKEETPKSGLSAQDSPPLGELEGARRLHLGLDIWGPAHTAVYTPLEGTVHSFAFNDHFGDYGATLILQHEINGLIFHSLYGHLSLASITGKKEGQRFEKGEMIATFGEPQENGHWPPHLHFQLILDMQGMKGDYPGVCRFSERERYLENCPDPDLLVGWMKQAGKG
jgi:very-short-patch-repair endonuclease